MLARLLPIKSSGFDWLVFGFIFHFTDVPPKKDRTPYSWTNDVGNYTNFNLFVKLSNTTKEVVTSCQYWQTEWSTCNSETHVATSTRHRYAESPQSCPQSMSLCRPCSAVQQSGRSESYCTCIKSETIWSLQNFAIGFQAIWLINNYELIRTLRYLFCGIWFQLYQWSSARVDHECQYGTEYAKVWFSKQTVGKLFITIAVAM